MIETNECHCNLVAISKNSVQKRMAVFFAIIFSVLLVFTEALASPNDEDIAPGFSSVINSPNPKSLNKASEYGSNGSPDNLVDVSKATSTTLETRTRPSTPTSEDVDTTLVQELEQSYQDYFGSLAQGIHHAWETWTEWGNNKTQKEQQEKQASFPTLSDTIEMGKLSALVYGFKSLSNDTEACATINRLTSQRSRILRTRRRLHRSTTIEELVQSGCSSPDNNNNNNNNSDTLDDDVPGIDNEDVNKNRIDDDQGSGAFDDAVDWVCHWYHHDRTIGTQVMIVTSVRENYLAVVFAGTDDVKTALTDVDILMKPYGPLNDADEAAADPNNVDDDLDPRYALYNNITLSDSNVRIHSGFNYGLFHNNIMGKILTRVEDIRRSSTVMSNLRLFTTGHSLGAASAVLTAVAITIHNNNQQQARQQHSSSGSFTLFTQSSPPLQAVPVTSINFGCPRIGNSYWKEYIHNDPILLHGTVLTIWRLVLGWDLVPRLPEFMTHEGHTIQLQWRSKGNDSVNNNTLYDIPGFYKNHKSNTLNSLNVSVNGQNSRIDRVIDPEDEEIHQNIITLASLLTESRNDAPYFVNTTHWAYDGYTNYSDWQINARSNSSGWPFTEYTNLTEWYDYWIGSNDKPASIAYYQHYGNVSEGYSGVPFGWFSKPFIWVPGALISHSMCRYNLFLGTIFEDLKSNNNVEWVNRFVTSDDDNDNNTTPTHDDDYWINPPTKSFDQEQIEEIQQEEQK